MMIEETRSPAAIAGMPRRVVAVFIDFVIIGLIQILIGIALDFFEIELGRDKYWSSVFVVLLATAYFAVYDSQARSASVGKQLMGLEVINEEGKRLSLRAAVIRSLVKSVTGILPVIWVIALFTQHKQSFHDLAVGSYVIKR
jgi:uncharacterized RDD family membrane protein YckC